MTEEKIEEGVGEARINLATAIQRIVIEKHDDQGELKERVVIEEKPDGND